MGDWNSRISICDRDGDEDDSTGFYARRDGLDFVGVGVVTDER